MSEFMGLKSLLNDTNDEDDINYFILVFDAIIYFPITTNLRMEKLGCIINAIESLLFIRKQIRVPFDTSATMIPGGWSM